MAEIIGLLEGVLWDLFKDGHTKHTDLVYDYCGVGHAVCEAKELEAAIALGLKARLIVRTDRRGPRTYYLAPNLRESVTEVMDRAITAAVGSSKGPATAWDRVTSDDEVGS